MTANAVTSNPMTDQATSLRALSHLHENRLLTDAEHAQALAHADLPQRLLRTPAEALGWVAARGIVAPELLPGLSTRAAPERQDAAHRIVADAVAMVSGQAPAWVLFEISLMAARLEDGVTEAALARLGTLQLLEPAQLAQAGALLPAQDPEWAAPDSPAATLAWTVRTGVLNKPQLQALEASTRAEPAFAMSQERKDIVADALARVEAEGHTSSGTVLQTEGATKTVTMTWTSTTTTTIGGQAKPWRPGKVIGLLVVAAIALYILFGR